MGKTNIFSSMKHSPKMLRFRDIALFVSLYSAPRTATGSSLARLAPLRFAPLRCARNKFRYVLWSFIKNIQVKFKLISRRQLFGRSYERNFTVNTPTGLKGNQSRSWGGVSSYTNVTTCAITIQL